jgi:hypothetical protein
MAFLKILAAIFGQFPANFRFQDIEFDPTILKTIKFFCTQEKYNTAKVKREPNNISCLEAHKNREIRT